MYYIRDSPSGISMDCLFVRWKIQKFFTEKYLKSQNIGEYKDEFCVETLQSVGVYDKILPA